MAQRLDAGSENMHSEGVCSICLVFTSEKCNNTISNCLHSARHHAALLTPSGGGLLYLFSFSNEETEAPSKDHTGPNEESWAQSQVCLSRRSVRLTSHFSNNTPDSSAR